MCHWNSSPLTLEREKQFREKDRAYLAANKPKKKLKPITADLKGTGNAKQRANKPGAQTDLQKLILSLLESNPMKAPQLYPLLPDFRPVRIRENLQTMKARKLITVTGSPGKHNSLHETGYIYSLPENTTNIRQS